MILHVAPDDKFVPFLQGLFEEALPEGNLWRVLVKGPTSKYGVRAENTRLVGNEYYYSNEILEDLRVADCVVFHSLTLSYRKAAALLRCIPKDMPVVWRGWGFDYYGYLTSGGRSLLLQETDGLIEGSAARGRVSTRRSPGRALWAAVAPIPSQYLRNRFLSRVDYFSCCVPGDYDELKRVLPRFSARFLPLNYYSVEDVFLRGEGLEDLSGRDVLLGNSATPTNNHVEAMRFLSQLGMRGRKVIVPLSYGFEAYREKIIRLGEELLGDSFVPLTQYMPLPEYNRIISSCGNIVMNHIRQQAIGNISAALLRGGKVFLRPENPIHRYYTRMGVKLSTFPDDVTIADLDAGICKQDAAKNREILSAFWRREHGIENARAFAELGRRTGPRRKRMECER